MHEPLPFQTHIFWRAFPPDDQQHVSIHTKRRDCKVHSIQCGWTALYNCQNNNILFHHKCKEISYTPPTSLRSRSTSSRGSSPPPTPTSWTSSAGDATRQPPSSATPNLRSPAKDARTFSANPRGARWSSQRVALLRSRPEMWSYLTLCSYHPLHLPYWHRTIRDQKLVICLRPPLMLLGSDCWVTPNPLVGARYKTYTTCTCPS